MSKGEAEIPVTEDYATSEEPTMPTLVEEGIITDSSEKVSPPVTSIQRKAVTPLVNMTRLSSELNGVSTDLPAHPVQDIKENSVTGTTTPKAEVKPVGRKRMRTRTQQTPMDNIQSCDSGTPVEHIRRVVKHSCNLCQSTDSTTPKRPHSQCNVSGVKRIRRKQNPGPTEELFAPLKLGWIREIVTRHISNSAKHDVYYHPPYGKKLRSIVEIGKYLNQENMTALLTVDNFTFYPEPLGYGEPFEITRGAILRSPFVSKANGSPKKVTNLTPKKGYHIKKPKLTPNSKKKPKTNAKSAKQKPGEKMAKPAQVAESSDEEYQVITEIAEGDESVALHLAETESLEIGHQVLAKNTEVQVKNNLTHASGKRNTFSSPERKELYQKTENSECSANTQSMFVAAGSVRERYITKTGSPKRIRITAENKNGKSSVSKKIAEHFQNVQKPVVSPQEDQPSPKESHSIKVNETHNGEHNNHQETEKNSSSRHNNYVSLSPVDVNERDNQCKVSETVVHQKSKRKRLEKNLNGTEIRGKEKLNVQKKQINKERSCQNEVLFVASGILENFEDFAKQTEPSSTLSMIFPTLPVKEEPVENEFLPVISNVKSGKEAEEMLETSEEPLRLWVNQTFNLQKGQNGKTIEAQLRNKNNYPETNGQNTECTAGVLRKWLKTNFMASSTNVTEQNFVPQNDKATPTEPSQISLKKKSNAVSKKNPQNLNRNFVTQTIVKNPIQPMVSLPVPMSEVCNTSVNVTPQNSHLLFENSNLQMQVPSSVQNPATPADSMQNPVIVTDSMQNPVTTFEIQSPSSGEKNRITGVTSNESDCQNFVKHGKGERLRELLTQPKKTEIDNISLNSKFSPLITKNKNRPPILKSATQPLNPNQPRAADAQAYQTPLKPIAPRVPGSSLATFTPLLVINAKSPPGPQSASCQSNTVYIQPPNTPLHSVAPSVPGTPVDSLASYSPLIAISTKQAPISQSANLPFNPNQSHVAVQQEHHTFLYSFDPNKPVTSVASQVCHSPPSFIQDGQTQTENPPAVNHKPARRKGVNHGNPIT